MEHGKPRHLKHLGREYTLLRLSDTRFEQIRFKPDFAVAVWRVADITASKGIGLVYVCEQPSFGSSHDVYFTHRSSERFHTATLMEAVIDLIEVEHDRKRSDKETRAELEQTIRQFRD